MLGIYFLKIITRKTGLRVNDVLHEVRVHLSRARAAGTRLELAPPLLEGFTKKNDLIFVDNM